MTSQDRHDRGDNPPLHKADSNTQPPARNEILLEMRGVDKSFPGVKALDNAGITVKSYSVHALMGENGAGKSTLLKCLFGIYQQDAGNRYG